MSNKDKAEELARKIWLAGLGAYGYSYDRLQEGYDKVTGSSQELAMGDNNDGMDVFAQNDKMLL
ncbi:MAG: hypothetical protein ACWA5K_04265, partial [bacterium]